MIFAQQANRAHGHALIGHDVDHAVMLTHIGGTNTATLDAAFLTIGRELALEIAQELTWWAHNFGGDA